MELMQAYELLKKATSLNEVISILSELKNTYNDKVVIRLMPTNTSDPLNSNYTLAAKVGKDGWYLPTGRGVYETLKDVINNGHL